MSMLERIAHAVQDSAWALTSCFCSPSATIKLNGRTFKIVKLLGEGGFSYVYLAQDPSSGRNFALKKIRCPLGSESVQEALREVEAYRRFRHPNIIRCLDSCVIQDKEGDGKIIYLFLPYYSRGNLQDAITTHSLTSTQYSESELLRLFLGTCKAVQAMHNYRPGGDKTVYPPAQGGEGEGLSLDQLEAEEQEDEGMGEDDPDNAERPLMADHASTPTLNTGMTSSATLPGGTNGGGAGGKKGKKQPWAHRDLKPANVMIGDDGEPVLMDFGSAVPARVEIPNRSVALREQDIAAEQSSMPYRAPELFDVKTSTMLTEAVDIWSLGAVLFALAYHYSPFETPETVEQGGSMALAVMNGSWKFPRDEKGYSEGLRDLIKGCLKVEPGERWDIAELVRRTEEVLGRLA